MTKLIDEIAKLNKMHEELTKKIREEASAILKPGLIKFLNDNPKITAISWTQFTPYFNDGEECVFSVNDIQFQFSDMEEEYTDGDEWSSLWGYEYAISPKYHNKPGEKPSPDVLGSAVIKELAELNSNLTSDGMTDALRAAFGDHVRVIVTRKGIEVEDYEHD